jgi:hypothetical protein
VANGTLSVTDNATDNPQTVALSGTSTLIKFSPIGVNFGNQKVGTHSKPVPVTLSNKGTVTLNISRIMVVGRIPMIFRKVTIAAAVYLLEANVQFWLPSSPSKKEFALRNFRSLTMLSRVRRRLLLAAMALEARALMNEPMHL